MTAQELYELLDKAGVDYEVVEIFEGARWLRIEVVELDEGEQE
jgi:glutaredoxin-related protein